MMDSVTASVHRPPRRGRRQARRVRQSLRRRIAAAFRDVPALPAREIVPAQAFGDDWEWLMADAFGGRRWTELSLHEIFQHRDTIGALSPAGYLSYLPAYLTSSLIRSKRYAADIVEATLLAIRTQRLVLFDDDQRAAVVAVLRYLADWQRWDLAASVLPSVLAEGRRHQGDLGT
jgi:hypothetical protein